MLNWKKQCSNIQGFNGLYEEMTSGCISLMMYSSRILAEMRFAQSNFGIMMNIMYQSGVWRIL